MIVKNWMRPTPMTASGEMLVSEANRIFSETSLHGLPVVENGRLRGLITRGPTACARRTMSPARSARTSSPSARAG